MKKMERLRKLLNDLKEQFKSNAAMLPYANRIQAQLDQAIADQELLHDPTRWKADCACSDSLALSRGTAYVGGPDLVLGLDRKTGKQVWSAKVSGRARGLAVAAGRLFVSTDKGSIHCFLPGAGGRDLKVGPEVKVAPEAARARHPAFDVTPARYVTAIITEATLSFLGVGVPPTQPSLGTLIRIGNDFLFSGEWWITIFPGAMLVLIALSVNLLGDWLRDALNPRLR